VKIIVAEKISASAVAQLQEPGWTVLTADQLDGNLEAQLETADALIVRSAVQADAKLLEHAEKAARNWSSRCRRGQHRSRRGHAQRHRGDEYAGRQCRRRGRADAGDDAGHGSSFMPRRYAHARRKMGKENRFREPSCAPRLWELLAWDA